MATGVVGMEILKSVSGLDLLQGMIAGKYPAPPWAELLKVLQALDHYWDLMLRCNRLEQSI